MTLLKRFKPALMLIFALILGVISASVAKADQPWKYTVRDHADDMIHTSIAIRQEILHAAPSSRLLGKMLAETGQMEANSAILKGWTYHRQPCHLRDQAEKIHGNVHRLAEILQEAQFRSDNGFDRRMSCTIELRRLINVMEGTVTHVFDDIPFHGHGQPSVIVNRPVQIYNQRPVYGNSGVSFQNTGPKFGAPTLQIGIGPRLKINVDLGGSGRVSGSHSGQHNHGRGRQSSGRTNIYGGSTVVSQFAKSHGSSKKGSRNRGHANHR